MPTREPFCSAGNVQTGAILLNFDVSCANLNAQQAILVPKLELLPLRRLAVLCLLGQHDGSRVLKRSSVVGKCVRYDVHLMLHLLIGACPGWHELPARSAESALRNEGMRNVFEHCSRLTVWPLREASCLTCVHDATPRCDSHVSSRCHNLVAVLPSQHRQGWKHLPQHSTVQLLHCLLLLVWRLAWRIVQRTPFICLDCWVRVRGLLLHERVLLLLIVACHYVATSTGRTGGWS